MRRLIINADDFGLTSGVNRAILEAHQGGVVTSTTLMATGPAFQEAAQMARTVPKLSVGCHVVLVDGSPLLPANDLSSLVTSIERADSTKGNPRLRDGMADFVRRALTGQLDPLQIEAEATAQIRRLQSAGLSVSHCDTHKYTHIFPAVLQPLLRAIKNCGVRALRNPFSDVRPLPLGVLLARTNLWKRYAQVKVLRRFADQFRRAASDADVFTPDGTLAVVITGELDERFFRVIIESMPEGTWEFVCHPGYYDSDLEATRTRLKESREKELRVLTSSVARRVLAEREITLISFRDIVAQ